MTTNGLSIGEVGRRAGVKVPTIRYYEEIGLIRPAGRTEANRRSYGEDDVDRLAFIRHSRELGFEIDAIRTLLTLQDDPTRSCEDADALAREHLSDVNQRISRLEALKAELERMVEGCGHGRVTSCNVIGVLRHHDRCLHSHH